MTKPELIAKWRREAQEYEDLADASEDDDMYWYYQGMADGLKFFASEEETGHELPMTVQPPVGDHPERRRRT
jgi:hypothetical protein